MYIVLYVNTLNEINLCVNYVAKDKELISEEQLYINNFIKYISFFSNEKIHSFDLICTTFCEHVLMSCITIHYPRLNKLNKAYNYVNWIK